MLKAVTGVVPLADYQLLLSFAGGESRVFDVAPYLGKGAFAALRDKALFDAVRISFDTVAWPNGLISVPSCCTRRAADRRRQRIPRGSE